MSGGRRDVAVVVAGQLVTTAGLTVVVPLLPLHLEALGTTGSARQLWAGVILAAPAVTLAVAAPLWGRAADRWGRKAMVVRALVGLGVSLALMAAARTPLQLLSARLLQGAAGGITDAGGTFVVAAAPQARAAGLGRLQRATAAGALLGPLAGGPLADAVGLRAVLAGAAVLTAVTAVAAATALREPAGAPSAIDAGSPRVPPARRARTLAACPSTRAWLLAGLLAQVGTYALVTVFAPHVRDLLPEAGLAGTWIGGLQAVTWAAAAGSAGWWGARLDRGPGQTAVAVGLAVMAVVITLQGVSPHAAALVPLRAVQGWCSSALVPAVLLAASRAAGPAEQGAFIGAASGVLTAGQVVGALAGGAASALVPSPVVIVALGGVVAGAAALALQGSRVRPPAIVAA